MTDTIRMSLADIEALSSRALMCAGAGAEAAASVGRSTMLAERDGIALRRLQPRERELGQAGAVVLHAVAQAEEMQRAGEFGQRARLAEVHVPRDVRVGRVVVHEHADDARHAARHGHLARAQQRHLREAHVARGDGRR